MKKKLSIAIKSTIGSIGISCLIFCLIGICYDISYGGTFTMEGYSFTRMCVGCMFVGLGFGLPCIVYSNDNMSPLVQSLIHMGIGCAVLIIVGFSVGWLPSDRGVGVAVLSVAIELGVALIIWALFYQWEKKKAEEMNKKIREKQK